jgi:MFS family permease
MASEMLYPVMPIYLRSIGYSALVIGILEGVAEATAGLSKGYFGMMSDRVGRRVPFVRLGYLLSAISKPLMVVMSAPLWVLGARVVDRLGKGVRTGARDAMLSAEAKPENKGRIFGLHRSMDTFGAVVGPALALAWLAWRPGDNTTMFVLAIVPGMAAVGLTLLVRERAASAPSVLRPSLRSLLHYWKCSPHAYRRLLISVLPFVVFNSSDLFLLMKARDAGMSDSASIGVYILYNLVFALFAYPLGIVADRIGLKRMFIMGLALFAAVYVGIAVTHEYWVIALLFAGYGIYAAATEGVVKALICVIVPEREAATAVGTFASLQSVSALVASVTAGALWVSIGAETTFLVTAFMAGLAALMVGLSVRT